MTARELEAIIDSVLQGPGTSREASIARSRRWIELFRRYGEPLSKRGWWIAGEWVRVPRIRRIEVMYQAACDALFEAAAAEIHRLAVGPALNSGVPGVPFTPN